MNRLGDQRASALNEPRALARPRIIFRAAIPLHIRVRLQDSSQALAHSALEEQHSIIEAVLADHSS